jgi:uridine kinase
MAAKPYCIAIAGGSGAGKTCLAQRLGQVLPASVLGLDCYYPDLGHLPLERRHHLNFDAPEALDWDLMLEQFTALADGRAIAQPVYDFLTHTRTGTTRRIEPGRFVIFEGLFALYDARLRALCETRVFVEAADALCLERRVARDVRERGRTRESVLRQYREQVRPMYERHVLPTRAYADLVLPGEEPMEGLVAAVLQRVERGSHVS